MKKKIVILGSTGSIGKATFDIIKKNKNLFSISLLSTNKNINTVLKQAKIFNVKNIIIIDFHKFKQAKKRYKNINFYNDFKMYNKIFKKKVDYVMSSISGLEGLEPTLDIIKHTKKIAIANKESIICGWNLIEKELIYHKTNILPVDSEHFSIWSLLNIKRNDLLNKDPNKHLIEELVITASGGPFLKLPLNKFKEILPKNAIKHPNWKMGNKISIDSATMMNKVFEVIEAQRLFNLDLKKIKIKIHPSSYIHSIVKFKNGLIKLLAHETSMSIPIYNSLFSNLDNPNLKTKQIDYSVLNNLNFTKIEEKRFPVVKILKNVKNYCSLYETAIVSANDQLVDLFLKKKIKFIDINKHLIKTLSDKQIILLKKKKPSNYEDIRLINEYVKLKIISVCI